ncbi:MAG: helix-turn-helix transcriptional regulator [bacterium]|nr:helix-turn-helix transcriptional regulator [bacterium]
MRHFKAEIFKTLSHPMRIRILDALREGEMSVGALQQVLETEQPTVSQHLAALRAKDFVRATREGTSIRYSVADPAIWELLDIARDMYERQLRERQALLEATH